jgi:hypothetical protein
MPDISMCLNVTCPLNDKCYRFMAIPSEYRQSYAKFSPKEDGTCDHFWPLEDRRPASLQNIEQAKANVQGILSVVV